MYNCFRTNESNYIHQYSDTMNISLQNYVEKYEKEKENNRKLQSELSALQAEAEKNEKYKNLIDDLKNNERILEDELSK